MIDLNTKTSEVISAIQEITKQSKKPSPCATAIDWMRQYGNNPISRAMEHFLGDSEAAQSWATWYLAKVGEQTSPALRKGFITKIQDPMSAFNLYLKASWLTDEEDELLEAKFKDKLPTAEAELAKGIVKRKKC